MTANWQKVVLIVLILLTAVLVFNFTTSAGIKNITDQLPRHASKKYAKRQLSQIEQIVVHHSAGNESDTPEDIARYHVGPNHICPTGCPGIAYHFVINRAGEAFQTNALETISYHIENPNTQSVGLCFIGNYDNIEPTAAQLNAAKRIVKYVNRKTGKKLNLTNHKDACGNCTRCPGIHLDMDTEFNL